MSINRIVSYKAFWAAALAIIFAGIGLLAACGGGGGTSASAIPPSSGAPPVVVPPTIPLATTCTATSGPLTLSAGAVRASGVAPLAIIFDATATIHTNPAVKTFHDIEYRWSFGDPGGNWATGSRPGAGNSRNSATGPVAAHVYENNGFYTIDVTAFDGTNTATCQILVTADDPDIVFAGAATTCISDTADFTGCPAGANQITTSNFATGVSAITAGNSVRRLLFRRGGVWNATAAGTILTAGPGIIGAFGANPAAPRIQSVTAFAAINPRAADWRIMDIDIDGAGSITAAGVLGDAGAKQILLLRLNINNLNNGLVFSDFNALFDQIAVVDSSISNIIGGGGGQVISGAPYGGQSHGYPARGHSQPMFSQPSYPQPNYPQPGFPQEEFSQPVYSQNGFPMQDGFPLESPPQQGGYSTQGSIPQQGSYSQPVSYTHLTLPTNREV